MSTMNSVLGFESGLIDISVRNAVGCTLKLTIPNTANVAIVMRTNDTIPYNYNNGKIVTMQVYAATTAAGIANFPAVIQNRLTLMNLPFTTTYDTVTCVFTFDTAQTTVALLT